jgi:hypothetical protein
MRPASSSEFLAATSAGFNVSAKIKVYRFKTASTRFGKLHLSAIYDANIGDDLNDDAESKIQIAKAKVSSASFPSAKIAHSSIKRQGSPFPSPTLRKKVLSLTHLKVNTALSVDSNGVSSVSPISPFPDRILEKFEAMTVNSKPISSPTKAPSSLIMSSDDHLLSPIKQTQRNSSAELFGSFVGSYEVWSSQFMYI